MTNRRRVLAGLTGLGMTGLVLPAWAQAIDPQSDPYTDPRNGFSSQSRGEGAKPSRRDDRIFERASGPAAGTQDDADEYEADGHATTGDFIPPGWNVLKSSYPTPAQWRNT